MHTNNSRNHSTCLFVHHNQTAKCVRERFASRVADIDYRSAAAEAAAGCDELSRPAGRALAVTHRWPGNQQVAVGVMAHLPSGGAPHTHRISNLAVCTARVVHSCVHSIVEVREFLRSAIVLSTVVVEILAWVCCQRASSCQRTRRHFLGYYSRYSPMRWHVNNGTARTVDRAPQLGVRDLRWFTG